MPKTPTDAPPSAARAREILEAPARAQHEAEQAEAAARVADAQRILGQAVAPRIAELGVLAADLRAFFQSQPQVPFAQLEEALGAHRRAGRDRVLMESSRHQDRITVATAEAQRVSAALEQPLDRAALDAELAAVDRLANQAPMLRDQHARWQALCAGLMKEIDATVAIGQALSAWLRRAAGPAA